MRFLRLPQVLQLNSRCHSSLSAQGNLRSTKSIPATHLSHAILHPIFRLHRPPLLYLPDANLGLGKEQVPILPV